LAAEAPTVLQLIGREEALVGFGDGGVPFPHAHAAFAADGFRAARLFDPDVGRSGGEHERGRLLGLVDAVFGKEAD
jgi:hypothetical protein